MNTPVMPLPQRIVAELSRQGTIPAREIGHYFQGVDRGALDCGLGALVRKGAIVLSGSTYSLPNMEASDVPAAVESVPTAEEEAAASLKADAKPPTQICNVCKAPKALVYFRLLRTNPDRRAQTCNTCHGAKIKKAQAQAAMEPVTACQSGPEPGGPNEVLPSSDRTVSSPAGSSAVHFNDTAGKESEPEKGHRQSSASALGKAVPEHTTAVHVDIALLIRQRRQDIAKQIELARVALDNLVNKQLEYDRYLELHERLSAEVAA